MYAATPGPDLAARLRAMLADAKLVDASDHGAWFAFGATHGEAALRGALAVIDSPEKRAQSERWWSRFAVLQRMGAALQAGDLDAAREAEAEHDALEVLQ